MSPFMFPRGLELASRLGRAFGCKIGLERVLLIDRFIFRIWKPTLHEVAVGTPNPQQEGLSYSILSRNNHFSFMLGDLVAFDPASSSTCPSWGPAPRGWSCRPS